MRQHCEIPQAANNMVSPKPKCTQCQSNEPYTSSQGWTGQSRVPFKHFNQKHKNVDTRTSGTLRIPPPSALQHAQGSAQLVWTVGTWEIAKKCALGARWHWPPFEERIDIVLRADFAQQNDLDAALGPIWTPAETTASALDRGAHSSDCMLPRGSESGLIPRHRLP